MLDYRCKISDADWTPVAYLGLIAQRRENGAVVPAIWRAVRGTLCVCRVLIPRFVHPRTIRHPFHWTRENWRTPLSNSEGVLLVTKKITPDPPPCRTSSLSEKGDYLRSVMRNA